MSEAPTGVPASEAELGRRLRGQSAPERGARRHDLGADARMSVARELAEPDAP